MRYIVHKIRSEPALLVGFVSALLILLTSFGVPLTESQQGAIIGVVIAIGAVIVRQSVTPNVKVGALEDDQGNGNGDLMAGQASAIPDGDPVDVVHRDETGDTSLNVMTALFVFCIILFIVALLL